MDADPDRPIDDFYADVGERLRAARQQVGVTQADLASAVGMTRSSIANLEAGRQRIPLHILVWLAELLDLPVADLLPTASAFVEGRKLRDVSVDLEHVPEGMRDFVQTTLAKASLMDQKGGADDLE